jgi:hypothetical protein
MIKKLLFTFLLCAIGQLVMAQAVRISGTVTDPDGPVMMANVVGAMPITVSSQLHRLTLMVTSPCRSRGRRTSWSCHISVIRPR